MKLAKFYPELTDDSLILNRLPRVFFQALSGMKGGLVLDIGCGSGVILKAMQTLEMKVVGIDISPKAISLCREMSKGKKCCHRFYQYDIRDFEIEKNSYTAITAMSSLAALKKGQLMQQLEKIKGGIKAGGVIYLEVFTTRDPIYSKGDKYLPDGENTFFFPQWNSFMYFFKPGELLHRFRNFEILDYKELFSMDYFPVIHKHHEARLCCRKPER